ncbi:MAG: TIGR01777 family oxidoreductase [Acidimicrobiia bacterium]
MRVAITGASGFIGSALTASLEEDGAEVLRIGRSASGPGAVSWDPASGALDATALEGLDAVVHLAGEGIAEKRWTDEQKRRIRDSRVLGTTLVANTLAELGSKPRVLVSGSGIDAYGDRGDEVLTESSSRGRSFLADVVRDWEAATAPAEAAGIRVAHLRSGIVLGKDGGALPRMAQLARFGLLGKIGSGRQWWSWIALDDQVRAIRHLIDTEVAGPVNLCTPNPATNADFTKALGRVLNRPAFLPIPSFGPKLVLGSELAETLLLESKRAQPEKLLQSGFHFDHDEVEQALRHVLK